MKEFHLGSSQKSYLNFCEAICSWAVNATSRKSSFYINITTKIWAIVLFSLMGFKGKAENKVTNNVVSAALCDSIYCGAGNTVFNNINYNKYYTCRTHLGLSGSDRTTLVNIQANFGGNANLVNIPPVFVSAPDLHLNSANNSAFDNRVKLISGIADDIDADERSSATPEMGANEFDVCTSGLYTWTGVVNDDWNVAGNWCSNAVPTIAVAAVIPAGTPNEPHIYNAPANAASVTLDAGVTLTMSNTQVLNIASAFTNNGTFEAGDGTVNFTAVATFSGTATAFNNLVMNGNLTLVAVPTINGVFIINGGQVLTNSPVYTSSSTLIYNITAAYTTGNEWNAGAAGTTASGSGIPQNVIISSGTITIPNTLGTNRALAGNMTINFGTTLQFIASSSRDLYILGDWTNNGGTFNANGRTVDFNLTSATLSTQTITGTTTFYNLSFGNANIITNFGTSITTVTNQFNNDAGLMAAGTSTVILTGVSGKIIGSAAKNFYNIQIDNGAVISHTTGGGNIHVINSFVNNGSLTENNAYTFYFDRSGATESFSGTGSTNFGKLTIGDGAGLSIATTLNASANFTVKGGVMTFFHNSIYTGINNMAMFSTMPATVIGPGTANFYDAFTTVALNLGSGISTINHNLQLDPGGSVVTNAPFYASAATLTYNITTTTLPTNIEWTNNTGTTGSGAPFNVTVQNANSVVISGSRTVPGTLNIAAGNTLVLNDCILTVNTDIAGSGALTGSELSGLILSGSVPALSFTQGAFNNYLKTLTLNPGSTLTLGSVLNIAAGAFPNYGTVVANGTLNTGGLLTLKSDVNGTALVGSSSGSITGNVTVERYMPAYRAWRFLAVPFASSGQTINEAWQEGAVNTCLGSPAACNIDPNPGYGAQITYNGNIANGFDPNVTSNPSLVLWDVPTQKWTTYAPPTTSTNIRAYSAYNVFVRGSRANDLSQGVNAIPSLTTLRITGVLNETGGSVSTGLLSGSSGQYVLIGNPFASPVNVIDAFNSVGSVGIDKTTFTVMDPKFDNDGRDVGAYVTYNTVTGWTPNVQISYPSTYPPVVQSGQGLMVKLNGAGSHQVSFEQSNKFTGLQADVFGLQAKQLNPPPVIYTNLMAKAQTKDSLCATDGIAAGFGKQFSSGVDSVDVPKLWNTGENISLLRNEKHLLIEFRDLPKAADTLFYRLYLRQQPHALKIFTKNLSGGIASKAWIVDKYLHTETEIDLSDTSIYNFTPNTDTNSYRNRFMLVFTPSKSGKPPMIDSLISKIKARIYPNPVSGKAFNLVLENAKAGEYTVNIFTRGGRLAATRKISYQEGYNAQRISLPATITVGHYIVQAVKEDKVVVSAMPLIISR